MRLQDYPRTPENRDAVPVVVQSIILYLPDACGVFNFSAS